MDSNKKMLSQTLTGGNGIVISLIILAIFLVVAAVAVPSVFQPSNIGNILRVYSPAGIMALGLMLVLLTGEIDISVGGIMSFSIMLSTKVFNQSEPLAIVLLLLVGLGCGFLNGIIITKFKAPSLMVTLGTMSMYLGLAYIVSRAQGFFFTDQHPIVNTLAKGNVGGIPVSFIIYLVLIAICWFMTARTRFGRDIYYTGANKRAAFMSGINIDKVKVIVYMICGVCAALAGPLITAQIGRANPDVGSGYEVTAIAIAVLGGTSLDGGRGSVPGVLCGMVTMAFLMNMLALAGLGTYVEMSIKGVLIIAVVSVYSFVNRRTGVIRDA